MDAAHLLRPAPLLALLALLAGCATTSGARPDQPEVADLSIEGTDQLRESGIKEKIVTSETPWWEPLNPFVGPNYFDPNAWQADLRRIERYYQAQGYYQAEILSETVRPAGKNAVALEVKVREGEPTRVGALEVTGMEALPPEHRTRALAELPVEQGEIFREEDWEATKELVRQRLRELGYAEAEVGGEVRVDLVTRQATVDLRVEPGPRYRFGNIFVATDANPRVNPKRIIEQAQGAVRKDEWYSESALAEAQARVFRMGVFGAVKVNRGAPDREAGTVPVVVDVREAPFRSLRLGGGVGVDAARQEVRALGEWTHRNFLGGLRRLTLGARVGYAFIPTVSAAFDDTDATPSGPFFELSGQFEQPRFLFRDLRLQTSLTAERGLEQAYNFLGGRARGGVVWQPHPDFSLLNAYNLELYRLSGQRALVDETAPLITLGCRTADQDDTCDISLSYLEQVAEWDRRNNPIAPSEGFYAALSLQEGGGPLQGQYTFLRVLPDVRYYHSFGETGRFVLAARVRLGTLLTPPLLDAEGREESSIVNRFFAGGSASMRGFNSRRLSPLVETRRVVREDDGERLVREFIPIGGNSLFETTVEMRFRLVGDLALAAFWDTGLVGQDNLQPRDIFGRRHYHALGFGFRYLTVVGPLRLDIGRRLNIGDPLPVTSLGPEGYPPPTCFGFKVSDETRYAGAPEGVCTFHLSIGEAF